MDVPAPELGVTLRRPPDTGRLLWRRVRSPRLPPPSSLTLPPPLPPLVFASPAARPRAWLPPRPAPPDGVTGCHAPPAAFPPLPPPALQPLARTCPPFSTAPRASSARRPSAAGRSPSTPRAPLHAPPPRRRPARGGARRRSRRLARRRSGADHSSPPPPHLLPSPALPAAPACPGMCGCAHPSRAVASLGRRHPFWFVFVGTRRGGWVWLGVGGVVVTRRGKNVDSTHQRRQRPQPPRVAPPPAAPRSQDARWGGAASRRASA